MTTFRDNEIVRRQFNSQADNFNTWAASRNAVYLKGHYDFFMMSTEDTLLDVACGTGDFCLYAAPGIKRAVGMDISEGMIGLALKKTKEQEFPGLEFKIGDVEDLPFPDASFSVVICKGAFHHMPRYDLVFREMVRCCSQGGRIGASDIMAYENTRVDQFFEKFEALVDGSHHATLSKTAFLDLYSLYGLSVIRTMEVELEYPVAEYVGHAKQTPEDRAEIIDHIRQGTKDREISPFLRIAEDEDEGFFFRRKAFLVLAEKQT